MLILGRPTARVGLAVLLVLATGCTSGKAGTQAAPTAATLPSAASGEQVLAVITASGELELYGIGPRSPVAHRFRVLKGPAGAEATEETLSGGRDPRICATWSVAG